MTIDINCDMGEGMPNDAAIMPFISSASIACGYHAGDRDTMRKSVELCLKHSVAIGAHPGFHDKVNFGRTQVNLSTSALYDLVSTQLHDLNSICKEMNATLHHVKPHGAMYNMAAKDSEMSKTIAQAVLDFNKDLIYYGLSGSAMLTEATKIGLKTAHEAFADRTYQQDGSLTSRSEKNALIHSEDKMLDQVLLMIRESTVKTVSNILIPVQAETICIHGDGEHALPFAKAIHQRLKKEGINIQAIA